MENAETTRDNKIKTAWRDHQERCNETQTALDNAQEAHARVHTPSLEQYQAEYAQAWGEYNKAVENGGN